MKRLLSILLIMAMLLSPDAAAFAQSETDSADEMDIVVQENDAEEVESTEAEEGESTEAENGQEPAGETETDSDTEQEDPAGITLEIAPIADQLYTGEEIRPDLEVTALNGEEQLALVCDTDYTVAWQNNIKPGTATVVVTGLGQYEGLSREASFTIKSDAQVTYRSYLKKSGYQAWKKDGKASGAASNPVLGFKVKVEKAGYSGSIQYRSNINGSGWQVWKKNGTLSGTIKSSKKLQAIQIKLTGELAEHFDVYYRVTVPRYGTLGWAKNGQAAGTLKIGFRMEAIQIKIVPKGSKAPGATKSHLLKNVTKPRYNNAIDKVITGGGGTLKGSYYWLVNHLTYERIYEPFPSISGYTQEESYAIHGIEKRTGNCYCFASAFAGAAKHLGYEAKLIKGRVRLLDGRIVDHGWVEIRIDGKTYICDPEQDYEHHLGLYLTTYSKAALKYYK